MFSMWSVWHLVQFVHFACDRAHACHLTNTVMRGELASLGVRHSRVQQNTSGLPDVAHHCFTLARPKCDNYP